MAERHHQLDARGHRNLKSNLARRCPRLRSLRTHDLGFPYLANVNVRWNDFGPSDLRYVRLDAREREKFLLRSGDILVCEAAARSGVLQSGIVVSVSATTRRLCTVCAPEE